VICTILGYNSNAKAATVYLLYDELNQSCATLDGESGWRVICNVELFANCTNDLECRAASGGGTGGGVGGGTGDTDCDPLNPTAGLGCDPWAY